MREVVRGNYGTEPSILKVPSITLADQTTGMAKTSPM